MSDWFEAFRIECQKHDETKRELEQLKKERAMPSHEDIRVKSDELNALADRLASTEPMTREEWEAIIEIRDAARCMFSAAGWLARLETT